MLYVVCTTGNSLSSATQDRNILDKAKYLLKNNMAASIEAVQQLDDFIFQLAVIRLLFLFIISSRNIINYIFS